MVHTVSARQLQREYKKVLEQANRSKKPTIVMANNKPLGAIISMELLEKLQLNLLVDQAMKDVRKKRVKVIATKKDLEKDLKELEEHVLSNDKN